MYFCLLFTCTLTICFCVVIINLLYMYNKCDAAVTGYAQPLMINILLTATIYVVY